LIYGDYRIRNDHPNYKTTWYRLIDSPGNSGEHIAYFEVESYDNGVWWDFQRWEVSNLMDEFELEGQIYEDVIEVKLQYGTSNSHAGDTWVINDLRLYAKNVGMIYQKGPHDWYVPEESHSEKKLINHFIAPN